MCRKRWNTNQEPQAAGDFLVQSPRHDAAILLAQLESDQEDFSELEASKLWLLDYRRWTWRFFRHLALLVTLG